MFIMVKHSFWCIGLVALLLPRSAFGEIKRSLIQGDVTVGTDVTGMAEHESWSFLVAMAVCRDGKPVQVFCGGTLIQPYFVLTAGKPSLRAPAAAAAATRPPAAVPWMTRCACLL